jgi:hypothetical protein
MRLGPFVTLALHRPLWSFVGSAEGRPGLEAWICRGCVYHSLMTWGKVVQVMLAVEASSPGGQQALTLSSPRLLLCLTVVVFVEAQMCHPCHACVMNLS